MVRMLAPSPAVPADTTNMYADNAAAATLGQRLFFDKRYSGALAVADDGTNGGLGAVGDTGKLCLRQLPRRPRPRRLALQARQRLAGRRLPDAQRAADCELQLLRLDQLGGPLRRPVGAADRRRRDAKT